MNLLLYLYQRLEKMHPIVSEIMDCHTPQPIIRKREIGKVIQRYPNLPISEFYNLVKKRPIFYGCDGVVYIFSYVNKVLEEYSNKRLEMLVDSMLSEEDSHYLHHFLLKNNFIQMVRPKFSLNDILSERVSDKKIENHITNLAWVEGLANTVSMHTLCKLHDIELDKACNRLKSYVSYDKLTKNTENLLLALDQLYAYGVNYFLQYSIDTLRELIRLPKPKLDFKDRIQKLLARKSFL